MSSTADLDLADCFDISGPAHIMSRVTAGGPPSPLMIDWNNEEDRRCVAACVVQGTYILETDRTKCRVHPNTLAPQWWESFNFRLMEVLKDATYDSKGNMFSFGAIFEHVPLADDEPRHPSAPQYIIAFRGTMLSNPKDIHLDLKVIANTLPCCKRTKRAHTAVTKLLATIAKSKAGFENCAIWLTGHSLGASLALDVGRALMSDQGLNLPTFLFNPPQVSLGPAINLLLPTVAVRRELHVASNLVKAGLGLVLSPHRRRMEALFERLSQWAPNLYVHDKDLVCQGYISYFEQRQQLQERFSGGVAKCATTLSYRDMLFSALGKEKERPHLLPSATLWRNSSMSKDVHGLKKTCLAAHELQQWWKPEAELTLSNRRYSI